MSAQGPQSSDLITFTIKVDGTPIPDSYRVHSIQVKQALNRISQAEFTVMDGAASREDFPVSAGAIFVPGKKVVVEAGYNNKNEKIFGGIIIGQNLRIDDQIGSALTVLCKDTAVKMTVGRRSALYNEVTDSDVMAQLIGRYKGISAEVSSTKTKWPALVQNYCTDWDFLLSRAEVNGMVVTTLEGTVSVFPLDKNSSPVLAVTYGDSLYQFDGDLNAEMQLASITASAWDPQQQSLVTGKASNSVNGPGNLSSQTLSKVLGISEFELQTTAPETEGELAEWAKAQMLKREYAKILAEARFQGSSKVKPGTFLTLNGLGARFNGDYLVGFVEHDLSDGNWFINASLGLSPQWFLTRPDVVAPAAAGLLPGIQGLYNATVKQIDNDPENEYRILLDLPLLDPAGKGVWARLTNFYSTKDAGVFFLPELGDEVIVGFLNQDPRYPVILGSVYSAKHKPFSSLEPNQENSKKAIVSRSHLCVMFDDKDVVLTLKTPNKNTITLDDNKGQISITDQNKNSIVMSDSGIEIESPKSITIQAEQNVTIKGNTGITIESSSGDVASKGLNIQEHATMSYRASGGEASVQGEEALTLKGGLVMIN